METSPAVRKWSSMHVLSIFGCLLLRAQTKWPVLKRVYDMRSDQWGIISLNSARLLDGRSHPYWVSGDNLAAMATPSVNRRLTHRRLKALAKTHLVAVLAEPLEPLRPAEALRSALPYAAGSSASVFGILMLRRVYGSALARLWRRSRRRLSALVALLAAAVLARALGSLALHRRATLPVGEYSEAIFETLGPWIQSWFGRPAMRIVSHLVQNTSSSLQQSSDRLATCCTTSKNGNDGLIDLGAQRWLDVPVYSRAARRRLGSPLQPLQRCRSSHGGGPQMMAERGIANSFSHNNIHGGGEPDPSAPLEPGKWHVMHIPDADHSLGTMMSHRSIGMYESLFKVLATISTHQ